MNEDLPSLMGIEYKTMVLLMMAYSMFLIGWVVYPSQKILAVIRKQVREESIDCNADRADDSWQLVWDFVPPILVPGLFIVTLLIY